MRSNTFLQAAALAGLVAASPAPQQLDFAQLIAAPTVQTAPVLNGVSNQTVAVTGTAVAQSISAAVSTTATAISTAPAGVVNKAKRGLTERDLTKRGVSIMCAWFGIGCSSSGSSTTTSTTSTTSSAAASSTAVANAFYIKIADNKFVSVKAGQDGTVSYVSSSSSATQFYIDSKTGYLVEVGGTVYAANRGTSANPELVYFSTTGQQWSYATCTQNTGAGWLECKANNVFQQAMTCNNDGSLYLGPTIGSGCAWAPLYYVPVSGSSSSSSSSSVAASTSSVAKSSSSSASSSSSSVASSTASSSSSSTAASSSSVAASTTSGTSTVQSGSGTVTSSSTTACPTTPEDGTYCGFINPEDPCAPQPDGYGPKVTPDTTDAFLGYAPFHSMASAAPTVVASTNSLSSSNAYQQTFRDLNASSSANSYLGLYTLTSYSVADCAAHCDTTALCTAFNIYIERDPSQNPCKNDSTDATVWGYWCPVPSSITNYKCTLWGSNLDASTATNQGGWRKDFPVVITGSNGYDATNYTFPPLIIDVADNTTSVASSAVSVATSTASAVVSSATSGVASVATSAVSSAASVATSAVSSVVSVVTKASSTSTSTSAAATATATSGSKTSTWGSPSNCNKKAINAPNYWMGSKFFPGPFNPQVCGDYASYQHALNKKAAIAAGKSSFTPCNSVNAYYIHKNGVPHGTYCALYDAQISTSYATYTGGWSGSDKYECKQSYTYTRNVQDSGKC